jgi:formylglycine-generating enzyme required for sulfatase activity
MVNRLAALLLVLMSLASCDRDAVTGCVSKQDSWIAAPRVRVDPSLSTSDFSRATIVHADAVQSDSIVDSVTVTFSSKHVSLTIPKQDSCIFRLYGFADSLKNDTVWSGKVTLSPTKAEMSQGDLVLTPGSWLTLPVFSLNSGAYSGAKSLSIIAPDTSWHVEYSVNGSKWEKYAGSLAVDTCSVVAARLRRGLTIGRAVAETLDVHAVLPIISVAPGTYRTPQSIEAWSPSGDALEYSTTAEKLDWKAYSAPLSLEKTGYFWFRSSYKGTSSDLAGGAYQIRTDSTVMGMKSVPAGSYVTQDQDGGRVVVTVSAFLMDSTEVTQKMYKEHMGEKNPSAYVQTNADSIFVYPVESVTWFDAVAFCNARSLAEGLQPVYSYDGVVRDVSGAIIGLSSLSVDVSKNGFRLPTDAEWEYAYRAGSKTMFYWSDSVSEQLALKYSWFNPSDVPSFRTTHPVAGKLPNSWGLFDMAGNVSEWMNDWYSDSCPNPVVSGKAKDPTGPAAQAQDYEGMRVVRGGSFGTSKTVYLSAAGSRSMGDAVSGNQNTGFRCVRRPGI